jgi:hypothetical protein
MAKFEVLAEVLLMFQVFREGGDAVSPDQQ